MNRRVNDMALAYTKTTWTNDVTPLNATNLNHMEDGIEAASLDDSVLTLAESLGWVNPEDEE